MNSDYLDKTRIKALQDTLDFATKNVVGKEKEQFVIAFCGIFSSGKSSLLNEILKQDFKLPTGGEPVTKYITRIEYGEVFKAYYIDSGNRVYLEENTVKDLVSGKSKLPIECQEIILQMPSEILKRDIVFLDTPGYEDDEKLEEITKKAVQSADMAVFCCNADHFGRRFEQEYFQELEDSLGNYLVVVNHADVIHTDEEFDRLKKYVEEMIDNRGSRKLRGFYSKTLFFTIGAGRYIDLDELDQCLSNICNSSREKLAELAAYASLKKLLFCAKGSLSAIIEEIDKGKVLYKKNYCVIQSKHEEAKAEFEHQGKEIKKTLELFRGFIHDTIYQKIDGVCNNIEQLEADGKHAEFVDSATRIIKDQFLELPETIKIWKASHTILKGENLDYFSSKLNQLLNSYLVPAPVGKQVKNRGAIGSLLVSGIVSVLTRSAYWDDGYDTEYHDYAKIAQKDIRGTFLVKLNKLIDEYLNEVYTESRPILRVPDASILDRIQRRLDEWIKFQKEVEQRIAWAEKELICSKRILICSAGFCCGKRTLFNALIKKDLMEPSPLPVNAITTIVEPTKPGQIEKIVYTYSELDDSGERREVEQKFEDDKIGRELGELFQTALYDDLKNNNDIPIYRTIFLDKIPKGYAYIYLQSRLSGYPDRLNSEFLYLSDAIVFIVSALEPLDMNEMRAIEYLRRENLRNVFFVINKINFLPTIDDFSLLKEYFLERLRPFFTDAKGIFNAELYNERVFYTDAFGALNTRMGRETPIARNVKCMIPDGETGVPDLEKALYGFLG